MAASGSGAASQTPRSRGKRSAEAAQLTGASDSQAASSASQAQATAPGLTPQGFTSLTQRVAALENRVNHQASINQAIIRNLESLREQVDYLTQRVDGWMEEEPEEYYDDLEDDLIPQ